MSQDFPDHDADAVIFVAGSDPMGMVLEFPGGIVHGNCGPGSIEQTEIVVAVAEHHDLFPDDPQRSGQLGDRFSLVRFRGTDLQYARSRLGKTDQAQG